MLKTLQNISKKNHGKWINKEIELNRDEIRSNLQRIKELEATISNQEIQLKQIDDLTNALNDVTQEKNDLQTLLNGAPMANTLGTARIF